jgi:hypothetical protein
MKRAGVQSRLFPPDIRSMSLKFASAEKERRRSERKAHVVEAFIVSPTAVDASERIEITSVNLSRHGVAFDVTQALAKKTYYKIEIEMGEQRLVSEIRIVACRAIENGVYQIGAEFC